MTYIYQLIIFALALFGILWKSAKTDEKGNSIQLKYGRLALTGMGKLIVVVLFVSFLLSLYTTYQGSREAKEKEDKLMERLAKVQSQNEQLVKSVETLSSRDLGEFKKQRDNFVSILDAQRQSTTETTQKVETATNTMLNKLRGTTNVLDNRLNASIGEVESTIDTLSMERDLYGVEISFRPSPKHWNDILQAYRGIKSPASPAQSFPYSASTMIADRRNSYWKIDFDPVEAKEGTVRFGPVSTDNHEGAAFENVINEALINLLITWGNGLVTEISPRGNYPSAITVSKDKISFILRPPDVRLNLNELKAHPTITLQGASYPMIARDGGYPVEIRFRSLDHSTDLDQRINPNWRKGNDRSHIGRVMPYVTDPYPLNVTFRTLKR